MKNLKSTKTRVILSLAFLLVLFGGLIPTLGIFSGGKQSAKAASGITVTEFPIPTSDSFPNGITTGPDGNLWFTELGSGKIGKITPDGTITEYSPPTSNGYPLEITTGPDGNLWFTELGSGKIGKITPDGTITEFPIPTSNSLLAGITTGPDGNLWFTEHDGNNIGRITPSGTITEFSLPSSDSHPGYITTGPGGNLWFIENNSGKIGKITPDGTITEYSLPTSGSYPGSITTGPDGNLWFTEGSGGVGKIGKITPDGTITEYSPPTNNVGFSNLTTGPDGNLWFGEGCYDMGKIGKITPSGTITEYSLPTSGGCPLGLTTGPDGNLWFIEHNSGNIGKITPSGTITEYSLPISNNYPYGLTTGPDGNLWYTDNYGNKIGKVNLSGVIPTPSPTPSLSINVTVSTPGGHFISSDPSDNAALPLHIHVAYTDGSPVVGAKVHLSNPNGFLAVFNPATDSNGNLDAPLPLPPSSLSPQPLTDGDFVSEVIATVNGKDYSSGSLTLYHADQTFSLGGTLTQAEAENYSSNLLLYYETRPGLPCSPEVICDALNIIDLLAQVVQANKTYSPKADDSWTIQVYKYSTPTMTPVYLYYESVDRNGTNIYNYAKWTEDITKVQPILNQQAMIRTALITTFASPVTVLAVSPTGQRAGFDPSLHNFVFDFPAAISNAGDEPYELLIPGPVQGQYTYQVTGTGNGTYTMTVQNLDSAGNGYPVTTISGVAIPGITDTYLLTYSANPQQPMVVVRKIAIDIKPGEDPPAINPNSTGVIPVAILSTPTFDATKVSLSSVRFGPANAHAVDKQLAIEDVNGDGLPDVVFHFVTNQTGIKAGNTQACLSGQTTSSANITGCDVIRPIL